MKKKNLADKTTSLFLSLIEIGATVLPDLENDSLSSLHLDSFN